jgi:hypothetical protein
MAIYYGLAPLLFKRLKKSAARACVPADAWERFRMAYFAGAGGNRHLFRELRPVLARLRSSGIPVIVLKGAYLAEEVYGDVALRSMCDIDLMVPRAELSRAQAVVLEMGGVNQQVEDIELCATTRFHLPPVAVRGLAFEIHWTIAPPSGTFKIAAADLWDRARPATIAGVEVLALSPEDLLLHLCLHFSYQHLLATLRSFCDIAETIHRFRDEMDWTRVALSAREWGAARYVGLTLHLARSLLAAEVPDDVLERLVPGGVDRQILETARESVLARTGYGQGIPFFDRRGAKSRSDKARLVWKRAFLSRGELAAIYPASRDSRSLWLYHALRFRDAIRAFGFHTLKRGLPVIRNRGQDRSVSLANWLKSEEP